MLCADTEPRHVVSIAQRLRAAAAEPFLINDMKIILSVAVGSSPAYVADPAALLREADRRMYQTKRRTLGVPVPEPRGASPTPDAHVTRPPIADVACGQGGERNTGEWLSEG